MSFKREVIVYILERILVLSNNFIANIFGQKKLFSVQILIKNNFMKHDNLKKDITLRNEKSVNIITDILTHDGS